MSFAFSHLGSARLYSGRVACDHHREIRLWTRGPSLPPRLLDSSRETSSGTWLDVHVARAARGATAIRPWHQSQPCLICNIKLRLQEWSYVAVAARVALAAHRQQLLGSNLRPCLPQHATTCLAAYLHTVTPSGFLRRPGLGGEENKRSGRSIWGWTRGCRGCQRTS